MAATHAHPSAGPQAPASALSAERPALSIRPAVAGDLDSIRAILNAEILGGTASWTTAAKTPAQMRDWFDQREEAGYPVLAGDLHGRVAGYGCLGAFRSGEGYRYTVEHSVYVAAEARGLGIGRRLLETLIAAARQGGYRSMIGGVSGDQAASLALHRAAGFAEAGRLVGIGHKAGRSLDLVLMQLRL